MNVLSNLAYFVFNAGIQLWFTPYLIKNLGVATYGLVPLATNITNYMAILTVALSGSVGRFLTIDLAKGDLATANRTFNTSLFASIFLAIALLPVAGALSWFAPSFLNIPEGEEMGTRFLLMCTSFAFLLNAVGSNFACSTFAKNRFDVQRIVDALGFITQIGVVVALFSGIAPNLWYVGLGVAGSAVVRQACYQISWRKLTPELGIHLRSFDRSRLREILGMGGWLTVGDVGWALQRQFDLVLANALVGALAAGYYAAVQQWLVLMGAVHGVLLAVLTPTVLSHHARGDSARVLELTRLGGRLPGLTLALPVGTACGLAPWLLALWVGPELAARWPLLVVLLGPMVAVFAKGPLQSVFQARNSVRLPALALVGSGLLHVGMCALLVRACGLGIMAIGASQAVTALLGTALVPAAYAAVLLGARARLLLASQAVALIGALLVAALAAALGRLIEPRSWAALLGCAACIAAVYTPAAWWLGLSAGDRAEVRLLTGLRVCGAAPRV